MRTVCVDPRLHRDLAEGVARMDDPDALADGLTADLADVGPAAAVALVPTVGPARGRQDGHRHEGQGGDKRENRERADEMVRLVIRHPRAAMVLPTRPPRLQIAARSSSAAAAGVFRPRDASRRRHQDRRRAARGECRTEILRLSALGPDSRDQEDRVRHQLPEAPQVLRGGRPDHRAHSRETRLPGEPRCALGDQGGELLVHGPVSQRRVLESSRARVRGPDEEEDAGGCVPRGLDEHLDRVVAEQWIGREGVSPEAADRSPGSLRLTDQGLAVGSGGHRHVSPLAVGDHQEPGALRRAADLVERPPAMLTQPLEARELRFHRDAGRPAASIRLLHSS